MEEMQLRTITLAGGCFWCIEDIFTDSSGVLEAVSGFSGGTTPNPTYQEVASGQTDYREAVQVTYNPREISDREVLEKFFKHIDPTDAGGQFVDRGHHYSTAVYYHTQKQQEVAETIIDELSDKFSQPIVTEVLKYTNFHAANEDHQQYSKRCPVRYQLYAKGSGRYEFTKNHWN